MITKHVPIEKETYVVIDLETTGLDHRTERITEIGAVKMVGGLPIETFEQLINPNRVISSKVTRLTGITNDMVNGAPSIEEVLPSLADFIGDSVLVVHNAPFDISFLNSAARRTGQKSFRNRFFDTRLIAQKLRPLLGFYRLANLAEHFNTHHKPNHRALPDALATAEVFSRLMGIMRLEGLDTVSKARDFFYPKERHDFGHKRSLAQGLPRSSGVYLMRDAHGEVIYVGKAKDLNKRVRSYFYSGSKSERQLSLLSEIEAIDHIKTGTEIGALLLESKLIKKFKPAYNVLGKRYRRYPFIHINYVDEFPTPRIVRKVARSGFHYGPFSNTSDLELLLEVTKDMYGLRQCDYRIKSAKRKSPCFYYEVNRCSAPCAGMITQQEYGERLSEVMDAFDGNPENLRQELIRRRDSEAGKLHFEKAALLKKSLESLERTVKLLEGIRDAKANLDFVVIETLASGPRIYMVEGGQLKSCLDVRNNKKDEGRLLRKIAKVYFAGERLSTEVTIEQVENLSLLTAYFHKRPVVRVKLGDSPRNTLSLILAHLMPMQHGPSIEAYACLDYRPQMQSQPASCLPLSRMIQHS